MSLDEYFEELKQVPKRLGEGLLQKLLETDEIRSTIAKVKGLKRETDKLMSK